MIWVLTRFIQARCIRLDGSQEGVVPRTCLSARPVKPRAPGSSGHNPSPRDPPKMGPNGRAMSPGAPPRFYQDSRSMSPNRQMFPAPPRPQSGRPMSPGPVQFPEVPRPLTPGQGYRAVPARSMSPGPYGPPGIQRPPILNVDRKRSNSFGGVPGKSGPNPSPLAETDLPQAFIARKPVPGQPSALE
jgi:hypothetical protein